MEQSDQELVLGLQQAAVNLNEYSAGSLANCGTGRSLSQWSYQYQYPYQYIACNHVVGPDEELLLNAIRRSPKIKQRVLKLALAELLKELDHPKNA